MHLSWHELLQAPNHFAKEDEEKRKEMGFNVPIYRSSCCVRLCTHVAAQRTKGDNRPLEDDLTE